MILPESIDPANKALELPWYSTAARAWAGRAWAILAPSLSYSESDSEVERTEAALHLVALATLFADFSDLAFGEANDTEPGWIASKLDMEPVLVGILAERAGAAGELEHEGPDWEADECLHSWCATHLVQRWRSKTLERLVAGLGGQRQLYASLTEVWLADEGRLEVDEDDPESGPVDVKRLDWGLVDVYTPGEWCYENQTDMSRDRAESMDMPLRVASWIKAGCPWLGVEWE